MLFVVSSTLLVTHHKPQALVVVLSGHDRSFISSILRGSETWMNRCWSVYPTANRLYMIVEPCHCGIPLVRSRITTFLNQHEDSLHTMKQVMMEGHYQAESIYPDVQHQITTAVFTRSYVPCNGKTLQRSPTVR